MPRMNPPVLATSVAVSSSLIAVDLSCLAADEDAAVGCDGDAFGMIEAVGERLDVIESDRTDVHGNPFRPTSPTRRAALGEM